MKRFVQIPLPVILFLAFLSAQVMAQKEANWWYFGNSAGVDFNTTPPTTYGNGSLNALEGVASMAHRTSGQLLFYTDGQKVWNRNHVQMLNGTGLQGSSTSSHSAVAVPDPGNANRYYIFTVPTPASIGAKYSVVDMTLNGGLGDVIATSKNTSISTIPVSDKIAAQSHSNGRDVWVIFQHENNWDMYAFLVTSTGVSTSPVISTVVNPTSSAVGHYGCAKISPDGKKMAAVHGNRRTLLLFDFNSTTGALTNQLNFTLGGSPYGVEFSIDSKNLYLGVTDTLYQYDVTAGTTASAISATKTLLRAGKGRIGQLQLAPDENLYIANTTNFSGPGTRVLSKVDDPNVQGIGCNYADTGLVLPSSGTCRYGLPTFIQSFFNTTTLLVEDACDSQYVKISVKDTSAVDSVFYNYGDSGSLNNTSWNKLDSHLYSGPGVYRVTAYAYYYDNKNKQVVKDTLVDSITVLQVPQVVLPSDTTICVSDSIQGFIKNAIYASPFDQYWSDSTQGDWFQIDSVGKYYLEATNRCGVGSDTIKIDSLFKRTFSFGNDTVICLGDSVVFDISDTSATYLWYDGDTMPTRIVKGTETLWGQSMNMCGSLADTVLVEVLAPPVAEAGNDTAYCGDSQNYIFVGEPASNKYSYYFWSNNTTTFKTWASDGLYILKDSNKCGVDIDSVYVQRDLSLPPFFGRDSLICPGDSIFLDPTTNDAACIWNSNNLWTDSTFTVTSPGTYWLHAGNACGVFRDTIEFEERIKPEISLPEDTTICLGDSLTLEVKWPNTNFLWSNTSVVSRIWAKTTGDYWVRASNECGIDSDTIFVIVDDLPTVQLPDDTVLCDDDEFFVTATGSYIRNVFWNTGNITMQQFVDKGGRYEIRVSNTCGFTTDDIVVEHRYKPQPNLGPDTTICTGDEIELRTNIPEGILDYTAVMWNNRFTSKELYVERDDWYRVEVQNICGIGRDTIKVNLSSVPSLGRNLDTIVCDDFLDYDFRSSDYTLLWNDGSDEKLYRIFLPGEYSVEIWDEQGCYGQDRFVVRQCASKLWVPNAFSPNFDKINETFRAYKDRISFFEIEIYDRWNNIVFKSNDITEAWDGTVENDGESHCAQGTYIWKIKFTELENNQMQIVTGEVSLIR